MSIKPYLVLCSGLVLGLAGFAQADAKTNETDALRSKVATLEARLAQLESKQDTNWLNERRAEEVKALVREVLSDADTRASLMSNGLTAGHNGQNFFLASEDGTFLLTIAGQIDFRYIANFRNGPLTATANAKTETGFEISRAKLTFAGHIADPKIGYKIRLAVDRNTDSVTADTVVLSYQVMEGVILWGGEDKSPFLHEDLVESSNQLAVERSLVNYVFTTGYAQGLGVKWDACEYAKFNIMINDGSRSGESGATSPVYSGYSISKGFDHQTSDFAVTARGDMKLAGEWKQNEDFVSWGSDPMAVFLGAAVHYEVAKTGTADVANNKLLAWTVDGSWKDQGWSVYAAGVGQYLFYDKATGVPDAATYGVLVQGAYNLNDQIEPFVRWEYINYRDLHAQSATSAANEKSDVNLLTFGVNVYQRKHAAKLTLDVVWVPSKLDSNLLALGDNRVGTTGLLADSLNQKNQVMIRAQYQLLF